MPSCAPTSADVRERTLEVLDEVDIGADAEDPLLREGFVYEMLLAHEQQHNETMLQLLQMVDDYTPVDPELGALSAPPPGPETIAVAAGEYEIGAPARGFAYDNERPQHTVELASFEIDRTPVDSGTYLHFMEDTGAEPPMYWERDDGGWVLTRMGGRDPIDPAHPVLHISWNDADALRPLGRQEAAHASSSGRLRTLSWTVSARPGNGPHPISSPTRASRRSPTPSTPRSSSATSTRCCAEPPGPLTRTSPVRSFRNWDLPRRRQIFAGVRLAEDA